MKDHIDSILRQWEFKPGVPQVRLVECADGREVIQMRVDLGLLQLERLGRPDGSRPHGFPTYFDYLKQRAEQARMAENRFVLTEEQSQEADREFVQFYHRRICWLSLQNYSRAVADADHTLAFMDFVQKHSANEEYTQVREQYRGFVLFQRTQAAAALKLEGDDAEGAVDEIQIGLKLICDFFAQFEMDEQIEEHPMILHLRKIEDSVRQQHGIGETLQEQLARAVENEDYEGAARLRDAMRKRQC
jgi:hypothetical protein